jgi:uncharacterized protein
MSELQMASLGQPVSDGMEPTQDERTMATLAHVLQLVGWWIAPLIIFLINRQSKFVSFHALQALLLQIAHVVVVGIFMVAWFAIIFSTILLHPIPKGAPPPAAIFMVFPLVWLGFMASWVLLITIAIVYGIKAGRGEWAEYPLLGKLARKMLKIGPGGSAF